jgi:hypothetical protein
MSVSYLSILYSGYLVKKNIMNSDLIYQRIKGTEKSFHGTPVVRAHARAHTHTHTHTSQLAGVENT